MTTAAVSTIAVALLLGHGEPPAPAVAVAPPIEAVRTQRIPGTDVTFELVKVPGLGVWMGRTEVTWDEFEQYYLPGPGAEGVDGIAQPTRSFEAHDLGWGRGKRPAVSISRHAAEMYCRWLSRQTGLTFRLPTEAEWEHAARGGATTPAPPAPADVASIDDRAWHAGNADGMTHEAGRLAPNAYGLYDMLGNAAEYCSGDTVVARGGSWTDPPAEVRVSARRVEDPDWNYRDPNDPPSRWWRTDAAFVGFRVVMVNTEAP